MISRNFNWFIYVVSMTALVVFLSWNVSGKVVGLFFVSGLSTGSLYALGGVGIVVLYRATGVVNFAGGAAGAAGVMLAWQMGQWGLPGPLNWLACIMLALIISLTYGRFIAPKLAWREPVVKAVATLGFALIILGITNFLWNDDPRKISLPTDKIGIYILGLRVTVTRMIAFVVAVSIVVAIYTYLNRTRVGLQMRSLANNRDLSALIGIPILKIETIAWGISGVIAGFTGLMFGDLIRLDPTIVTFMVIPSIAAAVCGRLENMVVVLIGGLSMGVIESLLTLSPVLKGVRPISPFVIATIVLLWSQRGQKLTFGGDD